MSFKVIPLLYFFGCVFSQEVALLSPCDVADRECLSKSTESFLEHTYKGIPEYDIKPIEPYIIPSLDVNFISGVIVHYENINITGLRNQKISDFKMDTTAKTVLLTMRADINIFSDATIEIIENGKSISGTYSIKANTLATARYDYEIKKDDKNVEHFDIGPETITCEGLNEPEVTLSSDLNDAIDKDEDLKRKRDEFNAKKVELRQKIVCQMTKVAYSTFIHNVRAAAKLLPKTAFFTNV